LSVQVVDVDYVIINQDDLLNT